MARICGTAGLIAALALPLVALAHGPGELPNDPKLLKQYAEAYEAYQQDDYAAALVKWRPLAKQGSSAAQLFIGFMYANGQGVPKNPAAASKWYGEAAERDNVIAQVKLALMYRDGRGVPVSRVKALYLIKQAAREKGHMQKIAQVLQQSLENAMTKKEIDAAARLSAEEAASH